MPPARFSIETISPIVIYVNIIKGGSYEDTINDCPHKQESKKQPDRAGILEILTTEIENSSSY